MQLSIQSWSQNTLLMKLLNSVGDRQLHPDGIAPKEVLNLQTALKLVHGRIGDGGT